MLKKNYLLIIIVIGLLTLSLYSTFAIFTTSVITNNIVNLSASTLPINTETVEYERIIIKSKEKKVIEFTVSNKTNDNLYYGVWYEMVKPSSITDDIIIGKKEDTQNDTHEQLLSSAEAKISFVIENKSSSSIIVNVGVGYSSTSDLNLPENVNLITEIYEDVILGTDYIFNIYDNASKSNFTNNNIEYERAEAISIMKDTHGNIRYYGNNPNNYVKFNNELWRIIGVFKNIDDGTGKKEDRLKIARNTNIGNYAWDSGNVNEWTTSTLKIYLNETYLDNIMLGAKEMIGSSLWNLGGTSSSTIYADQFYEYERGTQTSSGRSTEWTGNIGLMYPSDYMYSIDLSKCTKDGFNLNSDTPNCRDTTWLRNTSSYQWTLTPDINSYRSFSIPSAGHIGNSNVNKSYGVRPVLYLKSTVQIIGGTGTSSDPFLLG